MIAQHRQLTKMWLAQNYLSIYKFEHLNILHKQAYFQLRPELFEYKMIFLKACSASLLRGLTSKTIRKFANSINQPSLHAQRSVLATAIINQIAFSEPPKTLSDLSLRDRVLRLNPLIDNREISQQVKDEIFQPFTKGIPLNSQVYFHLFKDTQEKIDKQSSNNFVFCPNYLVTRQIFKNLLKTSQDEYHRKKSALFTGGVGMSKTFSTILYIRMSHYIHQFYQQALINQQSSLEWQEMLNRNLVSLFPRCWYWGVDVEKQKQLKLKLTKLVFEQTTDLPSSKREVLEKNIDKPNSFKQDILKFYPDEIHKKIVVDHIHILTNMAKQWNQLSKQKDMKNLSPSTLETTLSEAEIQLHLAFREIMFHLQDFQVYGDHYVLISSNPIEKDLLKRSKGHILGIGTFNQQTPLETEINVSKLLIQEKWAAIDFWQYFWFQVEANLLCRQVPQAIIEMAKKAFFNREGKVEANFTLSMIKPFLNKSPTLGLINKESTEDQITKAVCELRDEFYKKE